VPGRKASKDVEARAHWGRPGVMTEAGPTLAVTLTPDPTWEGPQLGDKGHNRSCHTPTLPATVTSSIYECRGVRD
jgi:hypothetical protein